MESDFTRHPTFLSSHGRLYAMIVGHTSGVFPRCRQEVYDDSPFWCPDSLDQHHR
jgi:hypothetical protein